MKSYEEYPWPMKNQNHRPFAHQVTTTEFLLRNKRAYVLSDLGTGKTLCALWATDILILLGKIRKVLVITPLSTMRVVWAAEIFNNLPYRKYRIAHGTYEQRVLAIRSDTDYVIINHDGIKSVESELIREKFDVVIIDELTAFKNATSDRSKCMRRIADSMRAVWGMTGAPTPNSPSEAFGQAKVVNPNNPYLPKYFKVFRELVEVEVAPYVWKPRINSKDVVYKVLQPSIRFERDQCLDIPPVFHKEVELDMSAGMKHVYEAIKKELLYEYDNGNISAVNAAVKFSKLLQVSAGSVKTDTGDILHIPGDEKLDAILEIFEELGRTKLIVVSAFRASVEHVCRQLQDKKIRCEYIHGDVNPNRRADLINRFQDGDLQILVLQPETSSHGITLTASNTIVYHSYTPSGETYHQMNGRITRAGQTKKQYIVHLLISKAERHMLNMLQNKSSLSHEILDMFVEDMI